MSNLFPVRSALIALSGGIDSAVLLALAAGEGLDVHAATIVSEFTPKAEAARANALAKRFGISVSSRTAYKLNTSVNEGINWQSVSVPLVKSED